MTYSASSNNYQHILIPEIRQILLKIWDPIGIGHLDFMHNEYDSYIPQLLNILNAPQIDAHYLEDYLHYVEIDYMNMEPNLKKIQQTSAALWHINHPRLN